MKIHSRAIATMRRFAHEEDGPTATEYAILLALLVLIAMATIRGIGERVQNIYDNIEAAVPEA